MQPLFEAMVFGLQTKDSNSNWNGFESDADKIIFIKFEFYLTSSNRPDSIRSEIAVIPSDN